MYRNNRNKRKRNRMDIGAAATWLVIYAGSFYLMITFFTFGNSLYFPKQVPQNDFPRHAGGSAAVCPVLSTAKFRVIVGDYFITQAYEQKQYNVKVYCTIGDFSKTVKVIDQWRRSLDGYASTWTMPVSLGIFDVNNHLIVYPAGYSENLLMDVFVFNDGKFIYTVISNSTY